MSMNKMLRIYIHSNSKYKLYRLFIQFKESTFLKIKLNLSSKVLNFHAISIFFRHLPNVNFIYATYHIIELFKRNRNF